MQGVELRAATAEDAASVHAIYAHYVEHSLATFEEQVPAVGEMAERIGRVRALGLPYLVAADPGGRLLGFGYCAAYRPRSAYRFTVEDSVYVRDDARGRGVGRVLLGALLEACVEAGIRQVVAVIAEAGGEASIGLHRSFGFTDAGRLTAVGYKHDQWVDTLRMQCSLVD